MIPVLRRAQSSPVADNRHPTAGGTLSRQPFVLLPPGVAFQARTWDNNDHSWREGEAGRIAAKHTLSTPRLRSYVSESKLEKNHSPASGGLAGLLVTLAG